MDYRKFLGQSAMRVLPYFGGSRVADETRNLRVSVEQPAGWYRFKVEGRNAVPVDRADPPDLSKLPAVRGHFAHGWLFEGGRNIARVELLPAEEPPVLSPLTARRWHSGDLVFDALEFETEAEDQARQLLEEGAALGDLKAVAASLRAAFAFALVKSISDTLHIPVSPRETMGAVQEIADSGRAVVEPLLHNLAERRRLERARVEAWLAQARGHRLMSGPEIQFTPARGTPRERAGRALEEAGAVLSNTRDLENGLMEVTYRFMGERFITIVNQHSLQVIDAGICLSGADREVTLESLPSVIKEGYETDQLNITRR